MIPTGAPKKSCPNRCRRDRNSSSRGMGTGRKSRQLRLLSSASSIVVAASGVGSPPRTGIYSAGGVMS
jgi:hypothetical protein